MVLGFFFPTINLLCRKKKKREESFTHPANVKNGGKIMVTWSLLPVAFPIDVMLNLSIDFMVRGVAGPDKDVASKVQTV